MRKFDEELNEIKSNLNNYKLSEEVKNGLKEKLDAELMSEETEDLVTVAAENCESISENSCGNDSNNKFNLFRKIKAKFTNNNFSLKLVPEFAVFFIVISGCFVFADGIESWIINNFSNLDKQLDVAIENGNYKKIDMDYVENNGVSIKVDYIVIEEDSLFVCFNVKSEEEFDSVYFNDVEIKKDNILLNMNDADFEYKNKKITDKNISLIYKIIDDNVYNLNGEFEINTYKVRLRKDIDMKEKDNNWNFIINY